MKKIHLLLKVLFVGLFLNKISASISLPQDLVQGCIVKLSNECDVKKFQLDLSDERDSIILNNDTVAQVISKLMEKVQEKFFEYLSKEKDEKNVKLYPGLQKKDINIYIDDSYIYGLLNTDLGEKKYTEWLKSEYSDPSDNVAPLKDVFSCKFFVKNDSYIFLNYGNNEEAAKKELKEDGFFLLKKEITQHDFNKIYLIYFALFAIAGLIAERFTSATEMVYPNDTYHLEKVFDEDDDDWDDE